jgi:hypothetical protein
MRDTSASSQAETDRDYRIEVRFGDAVLEAGHTAIPNLVLNHYAALGVSPGELVFVLICLQHKWTARNPFPSLGTIAFRMGVSRRQARSYAHSLKTKGLLLVTERVEAGKGQLSNTYDFGPFIRAVVERDSVLNQIPGKKSSEGSRKDPSSEEDASQKDESLISNSANEVLRSDGSESQEPYRHSVVATGLVPADAQKREAEPLAAILAARKQNGPVRESLAALPVRPVRLAAGTGQLESGITEISEAIGDTANGRSNVVRASRLLARSGLSESGFMVCVFRAHALLKERSRNGRRPVRRAGAYFFRILEDLLDEVAARRRGTPTEGVLWSPAGTEAERAG